MLLARAAREQPFHTAALPRILEKVLQWYERSVLRVDTAGIRVDRIGPSFSSACRVRGRPCDHVPGQHPIGSPPLSRGPVRRHILEDPRGEIGRALEFCELSPVSEDRESFWSKIGGVGAIHHTNRYEGFEAVEEICRDTMTKHGYRSGE